MRRQIIETNHPSPAPKDANFQLHTLARASFVFILCYVAAKVGGMLVISIPQTPWPLWLGCAVLVASLLVSPRETWLILIPVGLAGFVLYDLQVGVSTNSIAVLILGDIFEVLIAAYCVNYFLRGDPRLDSLKSFAKYSVATVILGSLFGNLIGIEALGGNRWVNYRIAFFSEALAFLTVTPAILGWVERFKGKRRADRASYLEAAVLFTVLVVLSYIMFVARTRDESTALLYSLVPVLLWAALRFGYAGAGTAATIVALVSLWGAVHGGGPFTETEPIKRVFALQLFLLFTAVPFMVLAVLVEERRRQEAVLRESEERFRLMADSAPTLVWMSGTDKLCTFFNRSWLNFTGRCMEQELGDGWTSGVHAADLERCLNVYSTAFDSRTDFQMEYRLRRYDGEYRWILDYGVPRFIRSGVFCGYIGSCIDITERKRSEIALHELTARLIHTQEEERTRIARELHDDISQRMACIQIGLAEMQRTAKVPSEKEKLRNLTNLTSDISTDLHNLSHQLHPARLDLQGLVPTLESFCRQLSNQHPLKIRFAHHGFPCEIPKDVALCLFRIVQEALRNVVKHARTSEANVVLSAHGDTIDLCVSDSGTGFLVSQRTGGLGLTSMHERLRLIGGTLTIESKPRNGTRIHAFVPLSESFAQSANEPKHCKASA
jgi:PAS domain S-box-containing protein